APPAPRARAAPPPRAPAAPAPPPTAAPVSPMEAALQKAGLSEEDLRSRTADE
ncbi:MAG: hypothetical protein DK306_001541, partial [Chloroflexi bacterium]